MQQKERQIVNFTPMFFMIMLAIFFSSFQIFGYSNDYFAFVKLFENTNQRASTEPFFRVLRSINDVVFHSDILPIYIVSTSIALFIKLSAIYKIVESKYFFALFCYLISFYWIQEYTQLRAACAIGVFLWSIPDIAKNNKFGFFLKFILAFLFHYSSIVLIVFYLYTRIFKNKRMYIVFPIIGFIFSVLAKKVMGDQIRSFIYILERYSGLNKTGNVSDFMSPFNLKYLILLVSFIFFSQFVHESDLINYTMIKAWSFGLCFYYYLNPAMLPVVSVRISEYYTTTFIFVCINLVKNIKIKEKIIIYICIFIIVFLYGIAGIRTTLRI